MLVDQMVAALVKRHDLEYSIQGGKGLDLVIRIDQIRVKGLPLYVQQFFHENDQNHV